jgi:hypothetical protein
MMNLKGFGQLRLWANRGTIQAFASRERRKSRKLSLMIPGVSAEIRTEHLPNIVSRASPLRQPARWTATLTKP